MKGSENRVGEKNKKRGAQDPKDEASRSVENEQYEEGAEATAGVEMEATPCAEQSEPPEKEVERLRQDVGELRDRWLRKAAELDNFRKRTARERLLEVELARCGVILPLLDVLDDFERALEQKEGREDAFGKGVSLIHQKLVSALIDLGVRAFSSLGEVFDPERMEAVARLSVPDIPPGQVVGEIRKGYWLNDRILRPAQVSVAALAEEERTEKAE